MSLTPKPPDGMSDRVGEQAQALQRFQRVLLAGFEQFGYEPVATPMVERAAHFVDRSGEDMRRLLYRFTEPGGGEICLRPELTIPTVRVYADQFAGTGQLLRAYYFGPVFRYSADLEGSHRQFTQAGVELIGPLERAIGDAEIISLAARSVTELGLPAPPVTVNDVGFFTGLLNPQQLSDKWIGRLTSLARQPRRLKTFLDQGEPITRDGRLGFLQTLATLDPNQRHEIVEGLVRHTQTVGHFGTRSMEEIVTRTMEQADLADKNRLPSTLVDALNALCAIKAPLNTGLDLVAEIAADLGAAPTRDSVDQWRRTIEYLDVHGGIYRDMYGVDPGSIELDLLFGRGLDYYTSMMFEVGSQPVALASGGRYDSLVQSLGASQPAPAVGFAINLDQVLTVLNREQEPGRSSDSAPQRSAHDTQPIPQPVGVVRVEVAEGQQIDALRVAQRLRAMGFSVAVGGSPTSTNPGSDPTRSDPTRSVRLGLGPTSTVAITIGSAPTISDVPLDQITSHIVPAGTP